MRERVYLLEFKARRLSWLPWPKRSLSFSKITSEWLEVHDLATQFAEAGATDVSISWWEPENAPPHLLEGR